MSRVGVHVVPASISASMSWPWSAETPVALGWDQSSSAARLATLLRSHDVSVT